MKHNIKYICTVIIMLFSVTPLTKAQYITDSNFDGIKKKADEGDAVSQYNIGIYYLRIIKPVTKESVKLARLYFQKAAMQGNAEAMIQLANCYTSGTGCIQNFKVAYMWLNVAKTISSQNYNEDFARWLKYASQGNQDYSTYLFFYKKQQ